jgi:hypothetical protein
MMLIALDPGFGNTKVCLDGRTAVIQTAVSRPRAIGLAASGLHAGRIRTVHVISSSDGAGGEQDGLYAVGPHAWLHGDPLTSLDYSALTSAGRNAIFYAALGDLLPAGEHVVEQLIIGLPVSLLKDQAQAQAIKDSLGALKALHEFRLDDKPGLYRLHIQRIKVIAQPVGAYGDWLIDSDLRVRKGGKEAEIAIMDIGLNTLDLYGMSNFEVEPRFVAGAKVGVRRLLDRLIEDQEMEEMDAELRSGRLRANKEQLAAWLGDILAVVEKSWPSFRRFTAVIPAGGGALLLGDLLRSDLARRGAAIAWPEDPVAANVRGLWKWYARIKKDADAAQSKPVAAPTPAAYPPRRGRPPKQAVVETAGKCTRCGVGNRGPDGLCRTCRNKINQEQNADRLTSAIERVVARAEANGDGNPVTYPHPGQAISAHKLG